MTSASYDDVRSKMLDQLSDETFESEAASAIIKNLKTLEDAAETHTKSSNPEEPTGVRGFFKKNSGDLIKAGTTVGAIVLIGVFELKGDVIFRSKAARYI